MSSYHRRVRERDNRTGSIPGEQTRQNSCTTHHPRRQTTLYTSAPLDQRWLVLYSPDGYWRCKTLRLPTRQPATRSFSGKEKNVGTRHSGPTLYGEATHQRTSQGADAQASLNTSEENEQLRIVYFLNSIFAGFHKNSPLFTKNPEIRAPFTEKSLFLHILSGGKPLQFVRGHPQTVFFRYWNV